MARPYQQHGLHALKRRLKVAGLAGIDGRSQAARALLAWRREMEEDMGGPAAISAQVRAVIDLAATSKLLLDSLDRYLLECDSLVNRKRRPWCSTATASRSWTSGRPGPRPASRRGSTR
jgi:hypothetical protein